MLFIDTQQYLDLYRLCGRKKLLGPLAAVADRVFITAQIADEVNRNKVGVATKFFTDHFKGLGQEFKALGNGLPDQLFSDTITTDLQAKLKEIQNGIEGARMAVTKAANDLLGQIGRSEDEVSRVLARIFERAVEANQAELDCARLRKERGRAPGKAENSLGDQINWEQFLARAEQWPQVWIVSRDGDFCHKYAETAVLNSSLFRDLTTKRQGIVAHCFTELEKGLRDFINANPIADAKLPTLDEAERINKEQESLPPRPFAPRGWLDSNSWDQANITIQEIYKHRRNSAAALGYGWNPVVFMDDEVLPPQPPQ